MANGTTNWPRTIIGAAIVIASLLLFAYLKGTGKEVALGGLLAGGLMMDYDGIIGLVKEIPNAIRAWRGKDQNNG